MPETALLIIDIQNDYFPGGAMELEGADAAGEKASAILRRFRERGDPIIHVRHTSVRPGSTFFLPARVARRSMSRACSETVIEKNLLPQHAARRSSTASSSPE